MSTPTLHELHELHAGLAALAGAIDGDDLAGADAIMKTYDLQLRRYIEQAGRDAALGAMRQLLQSQNQLLARMRERQAALGDGLRQAQRKVQASRAYAQASAAR